MREKRSYLQLFNQDLGTKRYGLLMGIRIKGKMTMPQEAAAPKRFKDFSYYYQTQELRFSTGHY